MINKRQINELREKIRKLDVAIGSDVLSPIQYYNYLEQMFEYKAKLFVLLENQEKIRLRIEKLERIIHDDSTNK